MTKAPIRVVVTGAAGQISYSLLALIAKGDVFGQDQPIDLVMLDLPFAADAMKGVQMELQVKKISFYSRERKPIFAIIKITIWRDAHLIYPLTLFNIW